MKMKVQVLTSMYLQVLIDHVHSHQQYKYNYHHHHNWSISNQTQTWNLNYHEEHPSKVTRRTVQNRPLASFVRHLQSDDDDVSISSENYANENSNIESSGEKEGMADRDRDDRCVE